MSDARLAQCLRCKAYTLLGEQNHVAVAVDVAAADAAAYSASVFAGSARYLVEKRQNGAQKLLGAPLGTPVSFDPETGAQNGAQRLHVEHPCPAKDQRPVKLTAGPPSAPATPGGHRGGSRQPDAPGAATPPAAADGPRRAPSATRRPSDRLTPVSRRPPVCCICERVITAADGPFYSAECPPGTYAWAFHEECP